MFVVCVYMPLSLNITFYMYNLDLTFHLITHLILVNISLLKV